MAEFKSLNEVRNYELSNGETADLIALISAVKPASWTQATEMQPVGTVVYCYAMGELRRGVVVKNTKTKTFVAITTQGAVDTAARQDDGWNGSLIRVQTVAELHTTVYVAPAPEGREAAMERFERETAQMAEEAPVIETPEATPAAEEMDEPSATAQAAAAECLDCEETKTEGEHTGWAGHPFRTELDEAVAAAENEGLAVPAAQDDEEALAPVSAPPVAGQAGSAVVSILERVWSLVREANPELPEVVIVTGSAFVGPPRWAHHRASGWSARAEKGAALTANGRLAEMFVAGETLAKGAAFTLETILHEAGHALAGVRGIKDTSRQGRWHNAQFKGLCQELGLEWTRGNADPQIGFSDMLITDATKERYAALLDELEAAIHLTIDVPGFLAVTGQDGGPTGGERIPGGRHGGKAKGGQGATPSSNNLKATCGCVEPRIIRASRKVLAEGAIMCGCCKEPFTLAE